MEELAGLPKKTIVRHKATLGLCFPSYSVTPDKLVDTFTMELNRLCSSAFQEALKKSPKLSIHDLVFKIETQRKEIDVILTITSPETDDEYLRRTQPHQEERKSGLEKKVEKLEAELAAARQKLADFRAWQVKNEEKALD